METKDFAAIKAQLQEQHTRLSAEADRLRAELTGLEDNIARIEAAIAVLSGTASPSIAAKLTKKDKKRVAAPSASKAQVIELMVQELLLGNSIQQTELKSRIEQKLVESGHNRNGYSLRFKEACFDSRFHVGANGISLKRPSSANPSSATQGPSSNGHERVTA